MCSHAHMNMNVFIMVNERKHCALASLNISAFHHAVRYLFSTGVY